MSSSPLSKRTQPDRNFEDYVLNYSVGPDCGLYPISNRIMTYVPGLAGYEGSDDEYTTVNIGFSFNIDGKKYDYITISTNGWCCLTPQNNFDYTWVMFQQYDNTSIIGEFDGDTPLLLCPWFDDLRSVYQSVDTAYDNGSGYETSYLYSYLAATSQPSTLASVKLFRKNLQTGKLAMPLGIDSSLGGVKLHRGDSNKGSYLVVRWKSFTFFDEPINLVTFDLVLYENGTIEFRYDNRNKLGTLSQGKETATCGIFSYGGTNSFPRYRDFGSILKGQDSRGTFINGGSVYSSGFTDLVPQDPVGSVSTKYIGSLTTDNWPGLDLFGAIFSFSPPSNRRQQRRSIVSTRDSISFINNDTLSFDDQKIIHFTKQTVEFPSMLPARYKTNSNSIIPASITELYRSGSIQIETNVTPGLFNDVLVDSVIDSTRRFK